MTMNTSKLHASLLTYLGVMIALVACQNESRDSASESGESEEIVGEPLGDAEAPIPALPYIAAFDEGTEQLKAEKNPDFNPSSLTTEGITQLLVANYPEIVVRVDSTANGTVYLSIADATYLTQQMGSSGAQMYLMEATYAYTELPDIRAVNFRFEEGDHAVPGNYTRASFKEGHIVR